MTDCVLNESGESSQYQSQQRVINESKGGDDSQFRKGRLEVIAEETTTTRLNSVKSMSYGGGEYIHTYT